MVEATEFVIKLRKLILAKQAELPSGTKAVTTASVSSTKPNRFTVTAVSGGLGSTSWNKSLYASGSNSQAYPSIRVIDSQTEGTGTLDLVGEPTIGSLAVGDTGTLFAGPLKTAHVAVTEFSKEAFAEHFMAAGAVDPMAILIKYEDYQSSLVNFSGVQQRGEFRVILNFVMLADDDVAIRNTLLIGCAVQQTILLLDEAIKADNRTRARFHTIGEEEAARLTYNAELFQSTSEPLERRPVVVASVEFPMNFM